MNRVQLLEIIKNGENQKVEFKRDDIRPEHLAKEIVAMANSHGGSIFLGVEDNGNISGIQRKDLETWIMNSVIAYHVHPIITPSFELVKIDDKKM